MPGTYSRYDDPGLVKCLDCQWIGQVKDCSHGYKGMPIRGGDVEPMDYCKKCGSKNLWLLDEEVENGEFN